MATLTAGESGTAAVLVLRGRLDAAGVAELWSEVMQASQTAAPRALVIDLAGLEVCDTAGVALLLAAERAHGGAVELRGAADPVAALIARARQIGPPTPPPPPQAASWRAVLGQGMISALGGVAFLGEVVVALLRVPARARQFRRADLLRTADQAGVRALPLTLLLGVLMGLILAFQSLIPMRRFGADLYVANLVAISLIRELGPLLAAVILAGRTGSAFAAEIGTMKVNQEIDALSTMAVDPMTFLVLPRLLAATLVMPALTVVLELAGLLGMLLVMVGAGYPPVAIGNQVAAWVVPSDFYGGLVKAAVFGAVVAGIGCRAGLATGVGPRAVGLSATSAVVGGIVATIILDGIFALVFYRLDL